MQYQMPRFVKSAATPVGTTADIIELGVDTDDELSRPFPRSGHLCKLNVALTSIDTATEVTWYLAADAAGDVPITPSHTATITTGQTAGKGGISVLIDSGYCIPEAYYVSGKVYLVFDMDAGAGEPDSVATAWLEFYR